MLSAGLLEGLDSKAESFALGMNTDALTKFMIAVTGIVGVAGLSFFSCSLFLALLWLERYRTALLLAVSVLAGVCMELLLKIVIGRPRPVDSLTDTFSFPSGHATLGAVYFFVLAYSFYGDFRIRWLKHVFVSSCCFLALLIGISRIYLDLHYLSDVLAGLALGIWCVVSVLLLLQRFYPQARGSSH